MVNRHPNRILGLEHLARFGRDPIAMLQNLAQAYPDYMHLKIMRDDVYIINSQELVHEVFVTQAERFHKATLQKKLLSGLLGNGLVMSDGDYWRRQRRLMQPSFHAVHIRNYAEAMVTYAQAEVDSWEPATIRDIDDDMTRLALKIICKTLFDIEIDATSEVGHALEDIQSALAARFGVSVLLPNWVPTPANLQTKRATRELNERLGELIHERRENLRGDLLSMLLQAEDEDGQRMTNQQVHDEAMVLFVAGHETTAKMLGWTWYVISQHPEVEAKLHTELDTVLAGRLPTLDDLPKLSYTELVLKESLRLYPPVWLVLRETAEDVKMNGDTLNQGALVLICPYVIQRDARYFTEPTLFRPERFADESIPRYAYVPFITGPRVCLGNAFAMMEAQLVLATIAQRYRLTLAEEVTPLAAGSLVPKHGIKMKISAR